MSSGARHRPRVSFGLATIAAAGVLTGCGGGGGTTLAKWRTDANAVCADARREVERLGRPAARAQVGAYLARTNAIGRRFVRRLRRLDRPEEQRARIERMTGLYAQVIPAQRRLARAYDDGNAAGVDRAVRDVRRLGGQADRIAASLGAHECARGPGAG